jgi:hypothetical protein
LGLAAYLGIGLLFLLFFRLFRKIKPYKREAPSFIDEREKRGEDWGTLVFTWPFVLIADLFILAITMLEFFGRLLFKNPKEKKVLRIIYRLKKDRYTILKEL